MPECPETGCRWRYTSMDELHDHLTDEHDAFTKVLQPEVPTDA